ncbi:MAG: ornithine--oxo-acid transaminase [Deltaproteobacteria bacterium]|nr:ornithine--oxo-acid transaminase [Deltaproteobacteria bacterium]
MPTTTPQYLQEVEQYSAHNYHPLPVVLAKGEGCWVWDVEGKKYCDMLSAYSALNQGHRHPKIIAALVEQAEKLTLTSRAFHNDQMGPFLRELCETTGFENALLMNSGAEAVETALKAARRWGYRVKGVPADRAEIICCQNNFHGRTISVISFSTEAAYREGFGPFTPGFTIVPYGDAEAIARAITPHTVAVLVEPIQGEGGVIIPPAGYLQALRALCTQHQVLFMADEIQTGLGRTGRLFACEHDGVRPDLVIIGKALSGGCYPVSAVVASRAIMDAAFEPGNHGSTFGGNPLACAIGRAALGVIRDERLSERAAELGTYFLGELKKIQAACVETVRGRGLLIGVEIKKSYGKARPYCERLFADGILAKETHDQVIRFAPPLVIDRETIDWALPKIAKILQ